MSILTEWAMGLDRYWKKVCTAARLLDLANLHDIAISAAAPASRDDGTVVQVTVTSQTAGLPASHGMRDMPSGRLPSVRQRPAGSLEVGMPAAEKALATTSLRARCLADLPGTCLQTRLCTPVHQLRLHSDTDVECRG